MNKNAKNIHENRNRNKNMKNIHEKITQIRIELS